MGEVLSGPGSRACAHSACAWPASSTLSFDYDSRQTWLDDLVMFHDPSTYDLCSVHAGRFRPPRGWTHEDRRRMPEPVIHAPVLAPELAGAPGEPGPPSEIALPEI